MIINRKQAEEAWELLARTIGTRDATELADVTPEQVNSRYKYCAMFTHPDRGGNPHDFAAVDRAKHVLINWLARSPAQPSKAFGGHCAPCDGKGFVRVQRGFKHMTMTCTRCRGTGDTQYEHEKQCGD